MSDFSLSIDEDGAAIITWDVPGRSINIMNTASLSEFAGLAESALGNDRVRGVIITSAKESFSGGMDLDAIANLAEIGRRDAPKELLESISAVHSRFRQIEQGGEYGDSLERRKPVVAALPGTAVGIGYELALACHRIIVADKAGGRIGLPEIRVGLFPGAGGTTRLVRRLGIAAAGPWLLKGTLANPRDALTAGLIDEVAEPDRLLERAKEWVLNASQAELIKPWDRKGYRFPGGNPYGKSGMQSLAAASAMVHGKTFGLHAAPRACLSAMYEGALVPFDAATGIEARWLTSLLLDPKTTSVIRTSFFDSRALRKGVRRPAGIPDQRVSQVGVIGAGMMGAGIALVAAQAGMDVVLVDQDQEAADAGKLRAEGMLKRRSGRSGAASQRHQETLSRIRAGSEISEIGDCGLIIEAVFEDPKVKASVIGAAAASTGRDCIFATNTSTLPIDGLSEAAAVPENFLGMHFFSPVDRMMLVEIIKGSRSGERAIACAMDFVREIRKVPILVNDARFFYANRCIIPYLNEGMRMIGEGVPAGLVENAAKLIGMPVGPLQLVDETSIELAARISAATKDALGSSYADGDVDRVIGYLMKKRRLGRKAGKGFYEYGKSDGRRQGLWGGLEHEFGRGTSRPSIEDVKDRLLYIQVLEAVRAYEDGVLTDVREGDVGAVFGWGLASWSGGPFRWLDMVGAKPASERARELADRHGPRFAVPAILSAKAAAGKDFSEERALRAGAS